MSEHGNGSGHGRFEGELMTDPEQSAVETLLGSDLPPRTARNTPIDTTFAALSHPGRRYVLTYLLRSEGYASMSDLVDYAVERRDPTTTTDGFRAKVTTALTHTHVPALEEEGFVEYNLERQLITSTEKIQLVAPYLKLALRQQKYLEEALKP
jgi:hypothetical protein